MKIIFKVSTIKEGSVVSLIKEVNKISCRIQIDLENGFIAVENVDDTMKEFVINLINQYYDILKVIIDTSDESTLPVVGSQSEKDLIIQNVEFKNKYVEDLINKFMRTADWAIYKMKVSEEEIGNFILTAINEISMRYNQKGCIEYHVGAIVDCNYGMHLAGEINGGHVSAIVCNVTDDGMAYVVPITKVRENLTSFSYLVFDAPNDVVYKNKVYTGGAALLDKGRYLRPERFHEVIGETTPQFFAKVLNQLRTTFDFTGNTIIEVDADPGNEGKKIELNSVTGKITIGDKPKEKLKKEKVGGEESALLDVIGNALETLDPTKKVEEQVEGFLTEIGMITTERMVTQSFVIACNIKKINYKSVILELHNMFSNEKEDIIKSVLKENFKKWLEQYPELVESCPKISLMAVLKVFAKRFV